MVNLPAHLPPADGWLSGFQLQLLEPQEQEDEDEMEKKEESE